MDFKLHATEQQMGQRRHQKVKKKKYFETNENGNATY